MIGEVLAPMLAVVVGDRFPRHRRGERHGEEIKDLRLGIGQHDLKLKVTARDHAGDLTGPAILLVDGQCGEGGIGLPQGCEPLGKLGKAQHLAQNCRPAGC